MSIIAASYQVLVTIQWCPHVLHENQWRKNKTSLLQLSAWFGVSQEGGQCGNASTKLTVFNST